MKKSSFNIFSVIFLVLLLVSCEHPITKEVKKSFDSMGNSAVEQGQKAQTMATDEIAKLFTHEYKVVEFELEIDSDKIEEELSLLGKERWNCFHVEPAGDKLRFYCKRPPKTYLRHALRIF